MILSNEQILDSARFNSLVLDQATNYQKGLALRFLDRLPLVDADDNELRATYTERLMAADVIAEDQAAHVYGGGTMTMVTSVLPKIKSGQRIPESQLSRLTRLRRAGTINTNADPDARAFLNWETYTARAMLLRVREQMNVLACAMMMDSYSYNRHGVVFSANWGQPAALKVTPSVLWTSTATSTPITDILTLKQYAANTYGRTYDRLTIGTADLLNLVSSAQFQNLIQGLVSAPLPATSGAYNARDPRMPGFLATLIGMSVEVDDKTYVRQNSDGTFATPARVLTAGKVLLDSTGNDDNGTVWDMGNAVVQESTVGGLQGGGMIGNRPPAESRGPFAYYTGNPSLNPPDLVAWAVAKAFPRRYDAAASATLTVA